MDSKLPSNQEIDELISYLSYFKSEAFTPVKKYGGGKIGDDELHIPFPIYDEVVYKFIRTASSECWRDYKYGTKKASEMLKNKDIIKNANLDQFKAMLTFYVRGERFCDGLWASGFEEGHIICLLERLVEIRNDL